MARPRIYLLGYGLLIVSGALLFAAWIAWRVYAPEVVTDETAQRFFGPAMTVTASLLIAVAFSAASILPRVDKKEVAAEMIWFFFAILSLVFGLFISAWGLASSTPATWVVIAVPLTWVWGCNLLLGGIVWATVHKLA